MGSKKSYYLDNKKTKKKVVKKKTTKKKVTKKKKTTKKEGQTMKWWTSLKSFFSKKENVSTHKSEYKKVRIQNKEMFKAEGI